MKLNRGKKTPDGQGQGQAPNRHSGTGSRNQGSAKSSKNSDVVNGNNVPNANSQNRGGTFQKNAPTSHPAPNSHQNHVNITQNRSTPNSLQNQINNMIQNHTFPNPQPKISQNRASKSPSHRVSSQKRGNRNAQPIHLSAATQTNNQKGQTKKNPVVATRYPTSMLHIPKTSPTAPVKELCTSCIPPKSVPPTRVSSRPSVVRRNSSHAKVNKSVSSTKTKNTQETVHRDQVAGPSRAANMLEPPSLSDTEIQSNCHHEYLMTEIDLLQSQPMWAISKAKVKPHIPIPQLPPMVELLHSSHAMLIQRLIQAYAQIENLRNDEENTFDTRANTPHRSFSNVRVQLSSTAILNRETELELGDEYLIVRTKLPVPRGQELRIESYYSLNQTVRRPEMITPTKSSCTLLSDLEFQRLLYENTKEKRNNMGQSWNDASQMSFDDSPGSPMDPYYEAILIRRTDRKMLLYINPKVTFHPGLLAADGSYVPYPVSSHPTHSQMSQIYVPCFDRSKTDLELKEIFKNNPPIRHKIVRKLPRVQRGSSVPAIDSYFGTEDLEKVGHNSYFIPMLCAEERNTIGWKTNYRYGKWKYSLQKIESVPSVNKVLRARTSSTHIGPEIHVVPERSIYLKRAGNSLTSAEEQTLGSSLLLDANGPLGCFQCLFPCIFTKPDPDDEPDLLEDWMEDPNSKKRKRRRRTMAKKTYTDAGGDIDAGSDQVSSVRRLPPPILVPVLGNEHTWFLDKPPPSDYNANMFAHTWNKDFGKPYPKDVVANEAGHSRKKKSTRRAQPDLSKHSMKSFFKRR